MSNVTNRIVKVVKIWEWKEYNSMFTAGISFRDNNKEDWINGYLKVWIRDFPNITLETLNENLSNGYFIVEGSLSFYNGKLEINAAAKPIFNKKTFTKFVFNEKPDKPKHPLNSDEISFLTSVLNIDSPISFGKDGVEGEGEYIMENPAGGDLENDTKTPEQELLEIEYDAKN